MIHVIRRANGAIKLYGEGDGSDWVLEPGETLQTLDITMDEYAAYFRLSVDKPTIVPDGLDTAIVTVSSSLPLTSLDILVNGVPANMPLSEGVGTLEIAAQTPGAIVVEPADPTLFCRAGQGSLVILAVNDG